MKKGRLIIVLCVLVMTALALAGCTTFNNFKEGFIDEPGDQSRTINIGVYEPMSGADKDAAAAELAGIELAHQMMPEADGHEIKLVYADNSSDIDAAETAIQTLLAKKPAVVLGSYGSIYSLVAGEYLPEAETPAIAITNTNPLVTRNNGWYFRVCYIEATQGRLLARYLDSMKEKEAGILIPDNDDAATALATAFTDELKNLTGNDDAVAFYEKYTTGDTEYTNHLRALDRAGIRYVLLPGEVTDAANIIKQADQMGLQITFLGNTSWGTEDFLTALTTDANGQRVKVADPERMAFVQFFAAEGEVDTNAKDISQAREEFLEAYHAKYGVNKEPEEAVALGYDAYGLAIDAVLRAMPADGSIPSGAYIREAMAANDYEYDGASGTIRFNRKGDPKATAFISTWDQGTVKAVYTIEADEQ